MVYNLILGDAEVIVAPLTFTKERSRVIDFLTPVTKITFGFVIRGTKFVIKSSLFINCFMIFHYTFVVLSWVKWFSGEKVCN